MIREHLYNSLASVGYPVYNSSTLATDPLEVSYITYFLAGSSDNSHYDNEAKSWAYDIQVIFFSSQVALLDTAPNDIRAKLKQAGFISQGKGYELAEANGYAGWALDFTYIEKT